jgi:hypothetical protein
MICFAAPDPKLLSSASWNYIFTKKKSISTGEVYFNLTRKNTRALQREEKMRKLRRI